MPIAHSSVWLRSAAGFSPSDVDEPFANFYFGGFGNNYVDRGDEKRYRDFYSLPGPELNESAAATSSKSMLEWNLPPWRFRRLGTPGFFLTWVRPALFVERPRDEPGRPGVRHGGTAGDSSTSASRVLSTLDMTLSAGGGLAFEDGRAPRRELMISLKVLK